jgi:hypothetical protein
MSGSSATLVSPNRALFERHGGLAGILLAAAAGLVTAVPVTTWWAVGDASPHVSGALTYDLGPYIMDPLLERTLGLSALAVTLLCLAILARATARHRLVARWWAALTPAVLAGVVAAMAWRAATAGFVGATIGGGVFALIGGGCLATVLLAAAVVVAVSVARRRPPPGWYPIDRSTWGYWDGRAWSAHTAPIETPQ